MEDFLAVSELASGALANVFFVHGLGGDIRGTWQNDHQGGSFWPEWLSKDLPQAAFYSLGYDTKPSRWLGSSMSIYDCATHLLARMQAEQLLDKPMIFVTHSLGGLVVKQILRLSATMGIPEWEPIAKQTLGVVFLATPHAGTALANYCHALGKVLRTSVSIRELEYGSGPLRELNLWYRNNARRLGIRTSVMFETRKTSGIRVVDEVSSDPGIEAVVPIPIPSDHIGICKPSRDDIAYKRTEQFIRGLLANPAKDQTRVLIGSTFEVLGPTREPVGPQIILPPNWEAILVELPFIQGILENQLRRAPFGLGFTEDLDDARERMRRLLGRETDPQRQHPILRANNPIIAPASLNGVPGDGFSRQILPLEKLSLSCPSCWIAPISVFISINEQFRSKVGHDLLDIDVDSTIGTDLLESLNKSTSRPDIIVVADGAMRFGSAPTVARDYEYVLPLFQDALTLLRRRPKDGMIIKLSGGRFCSDSAAQECMVLREIPGFNKEGKYAFERAPDAEHLIPRMDFDEGLFDSPLVAHRYASSGDGGYFIDDAYNSYYNVSMYCRRDLGWTYGQKNAWANVVVTQWVNLVNNTKEALGKLLGQRGLWESISRAALGYSEKKW
jgi:hypothetical protein